MTIENETETTPEANLKPWLLLLGVIVLLAMIGLGLIGYRVLERLDAIETQVSTLSTQAVEATDASERALARAERAEQAAELPPTGACSRKQTRSGQRKTRSSRVTTHGRRARMPKLRAPRRSASAERPRRR